MNRVSGQPAQLLRPSFDTINLTISLSGRQYQDDLHNEPHRRVLANSFLLTSGLLVFFKTQQANKPTEKFDVHLIQRLNPKKVRSIVSKVRLNVHVGAVY